MPQKIAIFVVLFNQEIRDVPSWELSNRHTDFLWCYLDNSVEDALRSRNHAFCGGVQNPTHLDLGGNLGLSKAYNAGLAYLRRLGNSVDWVVMLDQDTRSLGPFLSALSSLSESSSPICVPRVLCQSGVLSPRYFSPDLICQTLEPALPDSKSSAVNAGMAIRWNILEELGGYDEGLFLDYVDYDFLLRAYAAYPGLSLGQIPATIQQDFSGDAIGAGDLARFKIYCRDLSVFCDKHGVPRRKFLAMLFCRAAYLSRAHKSIRFLWEFFIALARAHVGNRR